MGVTLYNEDDGDLTVLKGITVAICGYGNQGRSQALNIRDAGVNVIIGNRDDEYRVRAQKDGFPTFDISEAVKQADALFLLVPDEVQKDVFTKQVKPFLREHSVIIFAHGYNIAFGLIIPPSNIDVLLIAPRMIGIGVRECILNGEGYFSFIGVHQDASGKAKDKLLALSKAVGGLSKAGIEISFEQETILDLFTEQGFGPASSQIMMKPIELLVEAGYPEEAVLVELILSGNMKHSFMNMMDLGIVNQVGLLDERSQYGLLSRGMRYKEIIEEVLHIQKGVLRHIEDGGFAKEWERFPSKVKFKFIKFMASRVGFGSLEKRVRKNLGLPEVDLWAETPYPTEEEIERKMRLQRELEEFKQYKEF
ncbi:MAG: NAD(P)-binding domain-containing protein [Candidatus Heimdallarchaeota archaeon]|nr:MAG: NAD(P)-binding domain-containing protein [Candidatus Heimdallarchaeota archaeon]